MRDKDAEKIEVSVIIPMFNEEENAENTLGTVVESLEGFGLTYEIIPVMMGVQIGPFRF